MSRNRSVPPVPVVPVLVYPDVRAAVTWLGAAYAFEERVRIGEDHRAQLWVPGGGALIVADTAEGRRAAPTPGPETHRVLVRVDDIDAHCERARSAGAEIAMEPRDFEYGERQYEAVDPAGHRWTFTQTVAATVPEDWGGQTAGPGW